MTGVIAPERLAIPHHSGLKGCGVCCHPQDHIRTCRGRYDHFGLNAHDHRLRAAIELRPIDNYVANPSQTPNDPADCGTPFRRRAVGACDWRLAVDYDAWARLAAGSEDGGDGRNERRPLGPSL